jgi:nucleoside-diphosphate-sugar epimerase
MGIPLIDQGRCSASLVYVDNLVDGIIMAGTRDAAAGRTYHFCDDWLVSWKRYLTDLSALIGKKPRGNIPFPLAWSLGYVMETLCTPLSLRPPVTRLAAGLMGRDNHVDTSKAKIELGWCTQVSYVDAIQQIGRYVKKVFPT